MVERWTSTVLVEVLFHSTAHLYVPPCDMYICAWREDRCVMCGSEDWEETWQLLDHSCSKLRGLSLGFYVLMLMPVLVGLNLLLVGLM